MEPGLRGCPLAGIPGFFCMNGLFLVHYFVLWGPGHRCLLRGSWAASVRVPAAPSGRKLAGLVRGGCLPADHTVQTRAAAAHCGRKHQHGLQSKRTLIWTNRAVARGLGRAERQRLLVRCSHELSANRSPLFPELSRKRRLNG